MVLDLQNLEEEKFNLGKSGRAIKLLYNKEAVQICTSTMYLPFGAKPNVKEWANFTEYTIDCSLNQSTSEVSVTFRKSMEKLDQIIQKLVRNNLHMFNSKNETANENFVYTPLLRENGSYPKLMKLALTRDRNGNFESFIFNEKKEKIPLDEENVETLLPRGRMFKSIIECVKIWYYNGKVGSIWRVVQLKFSEREPPKMLDDTEGGSEEDIGNSKSNLGDIPKVYNQLMIED